MDFRRFIFFCFASIVLLLFFVGLSDNDGRHNLTKIVEKKKEETIKRGSIVNMHAIDYSVCHRLHALIHPFLKFNGKWYMQQAHRFVYILHIKQM